MHPPTRRSPQHIALDVEELSVSSYYATTHRVDLTVRRVAFRYEPFDIVIVEFEVAQRGRMVPPFLNIQRSFFIIFDY